MADTNLRDVLINESILHSLTKVLIKQAEIPSEMATELRREADSQFMFAVETERIANNISDTSADLLTESGLSFIETFFANAARSSS